MVAIFDAAESAGESGAESEAVSAAGSEAAQENIPGDEAKESDSGEASE